VHGAAAPLELPSLAAIARRTVPHLLEATIVPAALFYVVLVRVGPGAAMVATLVWSYTALARRLVRRERVPAILLLALGGLTARTAAGVLSGSSAMYFLQPVLTTVVMAAVFLGSLVIGRPVVAQLAVDFCPIGPEVSARPGVTRLFRRLTVLWAGIHLTTGAATLGLLMVLPLPAFVLLKTVVCLAVTAVGAGITVALAMSTVRREGLVLARSTPASSFPRSPLALEPIAA
jgi:uncharacterized membrane protein